jgi:hypothetical protein
MVCSSPAFFLFLTCPSISRARVTYPHLAGALWMFPFRSHCPLITRIDANKREDSGTQPSHSNHPHLPTTSNNPRSAVHLNLPDLHEQACRCVPEYLHGQACWCVPISCSISCCVDSRGQRAENDRGHSRPIRTTQACQYPQTTHDLQSA